MSRAATRMRSRRPVVPPQALRAPFAAAALTVGHAIAAVHRTSVCHHNAASRSPAHHFASPTSRGMSSAPARSGANPTSGWVSIGLLAVGATLLGIAVARAGAQSVAELLRIAAPAVPVLLLLEALRIASE